MAQASGMGAIHPTITHSMVTGGTTHPGHGALDYLTTTRLTLRESGVLTGDIAICTLAPTTTPDIIKATGTVTTQAMLQQVPIPFTAAAIIHITHPSIGVQLSRTPARGSGGTPLVV